MGQEHAVWGAASSRFFASELGVSVDERDQGLVVLDGTAGAKVVDMETKTCMAKITAALEGFK